MGWSLMEKFFPEQLTYEARIDPDFTGTFRMSFDRDRAYTHHSQYLLQARLTGTRDSNLSGNARDNVLTGNAGDNILDGAAGEDTAIFRGAYADYTVSRSGKSRIMVVDRTVGRDGSDTLTGIEFVKFSDRTIPTANLTGAPRTRSGMPPSG